LWERWKVVSDQFCASQRSQGSGHVVGSVAPVSCAHAGQNVFRSSNGREYLLEEEQRGDDEVRRHAAGASLAAALPYVLISTVFMLPQIVQKAADIQEAISEGANSFLFTEYKYMGVFMVGW
jgi:hypothetical protein